MKHLRIGEFLGLSFLLAIGLLACHADRQERTESDSALMAPADTLGGDTSRQSPLSDTTTQDTVKQIVFS